MIKKKTDVLWIFSLLFPWCEQRKKRTWHFSAKESNPVFRPALTPDSSALAHGCQVLRFHLMQTPAPGLQWDLALRKPTNHKSSLTFMKFAVSWPSTSASLRLLLTLTTSLRFHLDKFLRFLLCAPSLNCNRFVVLRRSSKRLSGVCKRVRLRAVGWGGLVGGTAGTREQNKEH